MRRLPALMLAALLAFAPLSAPAQDRATLVSDSLAITGESRLVASGNVEVFFNGTRLKASRSSMTVRRPPADRRPDRADRCRRAQHHPRLAGRSGGGSVRRHPDLGTDGCWTSNAAAGRQPHDPDRGALHGTGSGVVASSCKVCAENPVPLWEIRARRVVHDQDERQDLLRPRAIPRRGAAGLLYPPPADARPDAGPRLRLPVSHLPLELELGAGLKLPYFLTLGPSRDLTLTPYLSTKGGRTLDLRYGRPLEPAPSKSMAPCRATISCRMNPRYLFAQGAFRLPQDFAPDLRSENSVRPGLSSGLRHPEH